MDTCQTSKNVMVQLIINILTVNFTTLMLTLKRSAQDAYARGEVFIGSKESGYTAIPGLPPSMQGYHWQFGITIVTPDRKFIFACETEKEQKEWIAVFQSIIKRPMLPQEYAGDILLACLTFTLIITQV